MNTSRMLAIALCLVAGCAQISGLSDLGVCDGSTCDDATIAADSATADVMIDASAPIDAATHDVYVDITCTRPLDCFDGGGAVASADAASVCCEVFTTAGKSPPCEITSDITQCKSPSNCATSFSQLSCGPAVARRCTFNADCPETLYNRCCSIPDLDATINICANVGIATQLHGNCM